MLRLDVIEGPYSVCRLEPDDPTPTWIEDSPFWSVTRTTSELSIVCRSDLVPPEIEAETGFRIIGVEGPLPFDAVGVISDVSKALAETGISVIVVSTFETDYLLVRDSDLDLALAALHDRGYVITNDT